MLMPEFKLRAFALVVAGAAASGSGAIAQQIPRNPEPVRFAVRGWPDGALAAAGAVLSAMPLVLSDSVASPCPCDPSGLPGWDRGTVGPLRNGPGRWSNVTLAATLGFAGAGLVLAGEPWEARAEDVAVLAQAVLVANGLTQVLKTVVARPRPYVYDGTPSGLVTREDVEAFPSGHAVNAFAAAAAYWSIQRRRGEAGRHKIEVIGLFALATATAGLRVAAHRHFSSDVVAGAALGTAVGWVLPRFHALH